MNDDIKVVKALDSMYEKTRWQYYDRIKTPVDNELFTNPVNMKCKTFQETNMLLIGSIPAPCTFLVNNISGFCEKLTGFQFIVNHRSYCEFQTLGLFQFSVEKVPLQLRHSDIFKVTLSGILENQIVAMQLDGVLYRPLSF